jgi:hypothetical protein
MSKTERLKAILDYYSVKRVKPQKDYYRTNADKYKKRDLMLDLLAGGLLLLNGFIPSIFDQFPSSSTPIWKAITLGIPVVLPALATAFLTLRGLHQYEPTQVLFRQTYHRLNQLQNSKMAPSIDSASLEEDLKIYIQQIEDVLANENVQWYARTTDAHTNDVSQFIAASENRAMG